MAPRGNRIAGLAQDLRDPTFTREFPVASIDERVPLQVPLGKVIRALDVRKRAARVRMASPNVLRAMSPRHNPTQDTLNRLLRPFRLRLSLAPIENQAAAHRGLSTHRRI
jgi:DNA-binding phage protein